MKKLQIFQIDAFTSEAFKGNPAAVCILDEKYDDSTLQNIAAEMNLSETAFPLPLEDKTIYECSRFSLRWFTPQVEVPLCGHATLATAAALFNEVGTKSGSLEFETLSGVLVAKKVSEGILLDFPVNPPLPTDPPYMLLEAMGITEFENVLYAKTARKLLVHLKTVAEVKDLSPNYELMKTVKNGEDILGVIVTAKGSPPYDFISRFFAPRVGINEDPVTGAAHTALAPYWSGILEKDEMHAYQASERGGELIVRLTGDRVHLIGQAVVVLKGDLKL
jgi:PhzF family phenazine biosynthesis protein